MIVSSRASWPGVRGDQASILPIRRVACNWDGVCGVKVGSRIRWRAVCCGGRRKEGRGRKRSRKDGWGGEGSREGMEDEARVLFEGVTMDK